MLERGDKAPLAITVTDEAGKTVSLSQYQGKTVVLYFYPKDDTAGCTIEAENFRDQMKAIAKHGAAVIGVSKDDAKSHQKFIKKYNLNFPLWSDTNQELIDAFGVWQLKKFMGREYMGIVRATFIIDPKGKIAHVFPKVSPKGHVEEVQAVLQKITA